MIGSKRLSVKFSVAFTVSLATLALGIAVWLTGCTAQMPSGEGRYSGRSTLSGPYPTPQGNGGTGASHVDARGLLSPESLPSRDEELWVIEKASPATVTQDPQMPGSGALMAKPADPSNDSTKLIPIPLKHTDVKADIAGYIATVDVTQQFQNPYNSKIEAVYVFPLPHNAAITEFIMTIGERRIRGIIRERQEAEKIYAAAKGQGYVAALMTQERPNIFTQSVANIEPGKSIDINIKYFHTLAYVDGWYEYVFPMVVGPRFNPPGFTDGVGAVPRGVPGSTGQKTEVQYLKPNERSGHDIGLSVQVDAGVKIEELECKTHEVSIKNANDGKATVSLASSDAIPNRDFILRYRVAGKECKSNLIVQRNEKDPNAGFFTLMLYPPESLSNLPRKPLEMVFTVDVSGSQSGLPLAQEKAAVTWALYHMGPEDTFQVVRFGNTAIRLFPEAVPANHENVQQATDYVNALNATEGTMLVDGVHASLLFPHDPSRLRVVTFLTDGFIGNEAEALGEIHKCLGPSRIFSFGVGASVNRYLLEHMAMMGNGAAAYIGVRGGPEEAETAMRQYFERISHPAMTDLSIDFGGMQVTEVYPQKLPDLLVGRPVLLTGRFTGNGTKVVKIRGSAGGESQEIALTVDLGESSHKGISPVWARMKIADLADRATYESVAELPQQILQIALEYGMMSAYTAFVAVDSTRKTEGDHGTTVAVPVPVPEGVRYDTTVGDKQ